ncbi:hypothetical protein JTB14_003200 [Gonioctena quinquepunctata]|nr:hypothetical protein JTB14_003200 [Gonioctena quinquepunctata]
MVCSDEARIMLIDYAKKRNDSHGEEFMDLITRVDSLVEVKARYHKKCLNNSKRIPTDPKDTEDSPLQNSLKFVDKNNSECQFTVSELMDIME